MENVSRQIFDAALALPDSERAFLAAQLIDSLDPTFDDNHQAAWEDEIARRINAHDNGTTATLPWEEVRARILGKR